MPDWLGFQAGRGEDARRRDSSDAWFWCVGMCRALSRCAVRRVSAGVWPATATFVSIDSLSSSFSLDRKLNTYRFKNGESRRRSVCNESNLTERNFGSQALPACEFRCSTYAGFSASTIARPAEPSVPRALSSVQRRRRRRLRSWLYPGVPNHHRRFLLPGYWRVPRHPRPCR